MDFDTLPLIQDYLNPVEKKYTKSTSNCFNTANLEHYLVRMASRSTHLVNSFQRVPVIDDNV